MWHNDVVIESLRDNKFVFDFVIESDKRCVLLYCPCHFNNTVVVLEDSK